MPKTIAVPGLASILRHGLPAVLECNLVPVVIFLALLALSGPVGAISGAFIWTIAVLLKRRAQGPVPGLLVLSTIGLTVRSVVALATGSLFLYFLQPTAGTALVGIAFLASVRFGRPLAERLAHDVCPFDEDTKRHPVLRKFLADVSLLFGLASAVNFAITLWLLLTQTTTTFVVAKSVLGPTITIAFSLVAVVWFRATMARAGIAVVWSASPARPTPV